MVEKIERTSAEIKHIITEGRPITREDQTLKAGTRKTLSHRMLLVNDRMLVPIDEMSIGKRLSEGIVPKPAIVTTAT